METPSIDDIRARLGRFQGRYPDVCARSGLTYSWVSKFASGERGKRPSFGQISRLTAVLAEMEAEEASANQDSTAGQ